MENIFDKLTKDLPRYDEKKPAIPSLNPNADPNAAPAPEKWTKETIIPVITRWKGSAARAPQDTAAILSYLKPTIQSALHSYAPKHETGLRASAADIALNSMALFDPDKDTDPSTYAFNHLKRLSRMASERSSIIHVPENVRYSLGHIQDASTRFEDANGREPSVTELADMTGMSEKRIRKILGFPTVQSETSTLSAETGDTSFTKAPGLSDEDYYDYVYRSVSDIDRKIMEWTSGIGGRTASNNEIAKRLHISPAAVSQRKAKIQQMMSEVRGLV